MAEGLRLILGLTRSGLNLRCLFIDQERQDSLSASDVEELMYHASRSVLIDHRLFSSITDTDSPQPVAAMCEMPDLELNPAADFVVAIDAIRDPGNLGAIIRTAAAAGVDGIALLPGSVDPFNPKVVRGSAGSIATLPLKSAQTVDEIRSYLNVSDTQVVLADATGAVNYNEVDWIKPTILVLSNEADGSGTAVRTTADVHVSIPMRAEIESLNVAAAAAILIYEAQRQRSYPNL